MEIDKNKFFREAAMQICGNLDIDRAMFHCLKILKQYMPADVLLLHLTELSLKSIRRIAAATESKSYKLNDLIPLTKEGVRLLRDESQPNLRIINNPANDHTARVITTAIERISAASPFKQSMDIWDSSMMVMVLSSKQKKLGTVSLRAKGKRRFSENHLKLFALLHEPFIIALSNALRHRELLQLRDTLRDDNLYFRQELFNLPGTSVIGADFGLKRVLEMVQQVAQLNSPILILGETGVGKEIIANTIHNSSPRKDQPFIKINCGAIPENLIDSELFGHEKGAFTGAISKRRGRFERAHLGSIFLDEIGELPFQAQVRLLRAVQSGEIERVGGTETIFVNTRIIAATNRNLAELVKTNQFREDLWFRLNVFPITIPPLRERKDDIPHFLNHFLQTKPRSMGIHPVPTLGYGAIDRLMDYHWPGNVRELENVIERELVLSKGGTLMFEHSILPGTENPTMADKTTNRVSTRLDDVITHHIKQILKMTKGRIHGKRGASELLDVKSGTLRYKMDKLGIPYKKRHRS